MSAEAPLGVIAGNGRLPALVSRALKAQGRRIVMVAHESETEPGATDLADEVTWVKLGQLGRIRDTMLAAGVTQVCLAGGLTKVKFFGDVRPDALAVKVLAKLAVSKGDDRVLRAIAGAFEERGMRIVAATDLAPELLAPEGPLGRHRPGRWQARDIELGFEILAELGRLDIGQAVVVKDGVVLAVEATEGTDACIRRGAELGRGDVVVVKAAKPGQDFRFDLPAVGPGTVDVLAEHGGGVIAVEAGRTVVLDREALVSRADTAKIPVVGVAPTR